MLKKQVQKGHYRFAKYVSKQRWASIWHQLDEVLREEPKTVLEIGPGPGLFKAVASLFGVKVDTLDIDPDLFPDYLASAEQMPFEAKSYDVVCAFQMLEHVAYDTSLVIFAEMSRVAIKHIVISLPDARPSWSYSVYVPMKGQLNFLIPKFWIGPREHIFDGEHYWELNKQGYTLDKVDSDLQAVGNVSLIRTYRVQEFPYHRFFVYRRA